MDGECCRQAAERCHEQTLEVLRLEVRSFRFETRSQLFFFQLIPIDAGKVCVELQRTSYFMQFYKILYDYIYICVIFFRGICRWRWCFFRIFLRFFCDFFLGFLASVGFLAFVGFLASVGFWLLLACRFIQHMEE